MIWWTSIYYRNPLTHQFKFKIMVFTSWTKRYSFIHYTAYTRISHTKLWCLIMNANSFVYMMYVYIQSIFFFRFTPRRLFSQYLQIHGIVSLIWAMCKFQIGKWIYIYFRKIILQSFIFKGLSAFIYMYMYISYLFEDAFRQF